MGEDTEMFKLFTYQLLQIELYPDIQCDSSNKAIVHRVTSLVSTRIP
jgi:hypothetical protein